MDARARLSEISKIADVADAVRLPSGAFSADGTEVSTDIVLFRRRVRGAPVAGWDDAKHNFIDFLPSYGYTRYGNPPASSRLKITQPIAEGRRADPVEVNNYWRENPLHVAGEMRTTGNLHNPLAVLTETAEEAIRATVAEASKVVALMPIPERREGFDPAVEIADVALEDAEGRKTGSFHLLDGDVRIVVNGKMEPVPALAPSCEC